MSLVMHNQSHGEYLWFIIVDSMLRIPISLCINHIFTDKSRGLLWKHWCALFSLISLSSFQKRATPAPWRNALFTESVLMDCIALSLLTAWCSEKLETWCRIFEGQEQCQVLGQTSRGCWEIMACCLLPCLLPYSPASDLPLYCFFFMRGIKQQELRDAKTTKVNK